MQNSFTRVLVLRNQSTRNTDKIDRVKKKICEWINFVVILIVKHLFKKAVTLKNADSKRNNSKNLI